MDAILDQAREAHNEGRYQEANSILCDYLKSTRGEEQIADGLMLLAENLAFYCPEGDDQLESLRETAALALVLFRKQGRFEEELRAIRAIWNSA